MRFVDLLKTTVLLSMGAATTLAVLCVAGGAQDDGGATKVFICAGWWFVAATIGSVLGRRAEVSPPIAHVLADAKAATHMPEHRPGAVVFNRLWPLFLAVVVAGGLTVVAPQIPGIAAGFTIIWALAWRRQESAVTAIEERDGVTFYVERTSPVKPMQLVRTPGLRREVPTVNGLPPA